MASSDRDNAMVGYGVQMMVDTKKHLDTAP